MSINIGSGVNEVAGCPKTITVTLTGQADSKWATDAILLESPTIKSESDGYLFKLESSMALNAANA
jgi:hypothetical protein